MTALFYDLTWVNISYSYIQFLWTNVTACDCFCLSWWLLASSAGCCGAPLAFSTAIIQHLKRICFGGNRDKACMWPPPKPSSAGCPPGGRGFCELQVRAKQGFCEKPRLAGITCVPARSIQWLLTWFVAFSSPSNAPLTYFLLIPGCDFNWREGGAGRGKGCVCVFLEGGGSGCRQGHGVGGELQERLREGEIWESEWFPAATAAFGPQINLILLCNCNHHPL